MNRQDAEAPGAKRKEKRREYSQSIFNILSRHSFRPWRLCVLAVDKFDSFMKMKNLVAPCGALLIGVAIGGCRAKQNTDNIPPPRDDFAPRQTVPAPDVPRPQTGAGGLYNMKAPLVPDARLTPGDALEVAASDVCVSGYSKKVRHVPASVKKQVYAEYGITSRQKGEYEVDHLISLELGGSNSMRNLWPQSYHTPIWNARSKDAVENELHRRICSGQIDIKTAQRMIATDWIGTYRKLFGHDPQPREDKNYVEQP